MENSKRKEERQAERVVKTEKFRLQNYDEEHKITESTRTLKTVGLSECKTDRVVG